MRWRFLDRVDSFSPWRALAGRKGVSFEEFCLLGRWGREGELPETLVLESCFEAARWLAAASSDFRRTATPAGSEEFRFEAEAGPGAVLEVEVEVLSQAQDALFCEAVVSSAGKRLAGGRLEMRLAAVEPGDEPERQREVWGQLRSG
jgi:3-hydroxymyristoyl/3-hydroxydecanoyl-(acyl carrier protein) dehydratase